jgi:hypothetical protein
MYGSANKHNSAIETTAAWQSVLAQLAPASCAPRIASLTARFVQRHGAANNDMFSA